MLVSPGHAAYDEAGRSAQQVLQQLSATLDLKVLDGGADGSTEAAASATSLAGDPTLVVAIGSRAARAARQMAPRTPLVYGMVLDPLSLGPAQNVTGVTMDVPADVQLDLIQDLVPAARRIGILYDPLVSGAVVRATSDSARGRGLTLVPQPVRSEGEVLEAARLLSAVSDVLWAPADTTVLTSTTSRALILQALRANRPLFAPSESFVQTGALAAVRADAREVGRRTGEVAALLLRGASPATIRPEPPPKYSIYLNRAVASHLGIAIPTELATRAEAIYPRP